jgi:hypothetical protein
MERKPKLVMKHTISWDRCLDEQRQQCVAPANSQRKLWRDKFDKFSTGTQNQIRMRRTDLNRITVPSSECGLESGKRSASFCNRKG